MRQKYDKSSIEGKIYRLILSLFLPMLAVAFFILVMLITANLQYASISGNISKASGFSQDFKSDVDLKMYYYVTGSREELPLEEIRAARTLAEELLENTRDPESRKAIETVLILCESLEASIDSIANTEGYDTHMLQLENNIYVITRLIQQYIYTYLYCEAGQMAALQQQLNFMLVLEILAICLVIVMVAVISARRAVGISRSITDPISAIYRRVQEIGHGDLTEKTPVQAEDSKLRALSSGIEDMAVRLDRQIEVNRQEQIRLRSIELSLLQAQINPHFLYNTLDAIVWLIETGKNQQAEEMVTSLSNYFRAFLSNGKDIVTLGEEEQHIRSYLEIQQVRYQDRLTYEIRMDPGLRNVQIPKMTLQPLVENAIYHGIKPKRGVGLITVTSCLEHERVILTVSDTGNGMDPAALEKLWEDIRGEDARGFGLAATYKRLQLAYGAEFSFSIDSRPGEGTAITMGIPCRTEAENEV